MTLKQFDRLSRRDMENGAVLDEIRNALKAREKAEAEVARLKAELEQYHELIFAVEQKIEGESRHQTALRYIREAGNRSAGVGQTAEAKGGGK